MQEIELIQELPHDFWTSWRTMADIPQEDVEVYQILTGEPMILFEYSDGTKYGVTIADIFNKVIHPFHSNKPRNQTVTPKPVEKQKKVQKSTKAVSTRAAKVASKKVQPQKKALSVSAKGAKISVKIQPIKALKAQKRKK